MKEEWLTIIIVLLMIGIALDGYRRMRNARRENIRLSKNAKKADLEGERTHSSSEFPSGGARVASYREPDEAQNLNKTVKQTAAAKRVTVGAPQRIPQQVALNLEESVPMLMDSVELESKQEPQHDDAHHYQNAVSDDAYEAEYEEEFEAEADFDQEEHRHARVGEADSEEDILGNDHREPQIGDFNGLDEIDEVPEQPLKTHKAKTPSPTKIELENRAEQKHVEQKSTQQERAPSWDASPQKPSPQKPSPQKQAPQKQAPQKPTPQQEEAEEAFKEPDEVLIMNIMARAGTRFAGPQLLQALMNEGLKLGAMDIFHRHMNNDGDAPVLFSLANMVVPGTFNLSEMEQFQTPGVSLFLSLPVDGESLAAYEDLARTARNIAQQLDGELKDENRSVMTSQTIEHGRQRVIEYERKKKLARV